MERAAVAEALASVAAVPGRFERVEAGQPFLVVVDYAHTPDALERVLDHGRARLVAAGARLSVVFGCGGDRDRGKRPLMGGIAGRLADRIWVTSDNPRSEVPERDHRRDRGGPACGGRRGHHVAMRRPEGRHPRAHSNAAGTGDVVVIAGKGHETYQIIGADVLPFDDRAVARQVLARPEDPRCVPPTGRGRGARHTRGAGQRGSRARPSPACPSTPARSAWARCSSRSAATPWTATPTWPTPPPAGRPAWWSTRSRTTCRRRCRRSSWTTPPAPSAASPRTTASGSRCRWPR